MKFHFSLRSTTVVMPARKKNTKSSSQRRIAHIDVSLSFKETT